MARAQATTDHSVIRRWIEAHHGHPSVVRATQGRKQGSAGLLRVDFDEAEASLKEISWDDFFDTFDKNDLAFLFQAERDSRFHKFVSRDSIDEDDLEAASEEEEEEEEEDEDFDEDESEDDDEDEDEDDDEDEDADEDEDEDEDKPTRGKKP